MRCSLAALVLAAACGASRGHSDRPAQATPDPDGPHRAAVVAQIQPLIDGELATGIVVGLYDAGKLEIYGFGHGPNGKPPDGRTLFELGTLTEVYTSILFADAVQRKEVELDAPLSELLPPGVTAPTRDKAVITLRELALHSAGLPRQPRTIVQRAATPDPYAGYGEDALYADLVQAQLDAAPGTQIEHSDFGSGVLGFTLGRKIGGGLPHAIESRVLPALGLRDTYFAPPPDAKARRVQGTSTDLAAIPGWTWGALAGAGGLVSTVRDQLALIGAEIEGYNGSRLSLRPALKLTLEPQLDRQSGNESLGWQVDSSGRYVHDGETAGFRCIVGFDPKAKRGVVLLAATGNTALLRPFDSLWQLLDNDKPAPPVLPTAEELAPLVGHYDLGGSKIAITQHGRRVYIEGDGTKVRLVPFAAGQFWLEELQSVAVFERDGDKVARIVFVVGEHRLVATRTD